MIAETTTVHRHTVEGTDRVLAELEKIRAEQARVGDAVSKTEQSLVAQNKKLNESIAFWGKVSVGIQALPGVIGKVQDAFGEAADLLKMKSAAAGVNVEALSDALHGQLTTVEEYSLAASINSAKVKLNAEQQVVLAGAIRKLGLEGKNVTEVTKDFQKVLATGEANELKKYGIGVTDLDGKAKDFASVLRDELTPMAKKAGDTATTEGERMAAAANKISDAFTKAKLAAAEWGVATVEALGNVGKTIGKEMGSGGWLDTLLAFAGVNMDNMNRQRDAANAVLDEAAAEAGHQRDMAKKAARISSGFADYYAQVAAAQRSAARDAAASATDPSIDLTKGRTAGEEAAARRRGSGGGRRSGPSAAEQAALDSYWASIRAANAAAPAAMQARTFDALPLDAVAEHMTTIDGVLARTAAFYGSSNWFEQTIGPASFFDVYAEGFGMLEDSIRAAAEAWITGSEGGVGAAKRAAAGRLTVVATEAAVQAAYNAAWAINDYAVGDVAHGSLRAAAAAKFTATAFAAGAGARLLGSGSGGSTPALGGGSGAAPLSGNPALEGGGAATNSVIVYGDSFADDSPRMRQRKARELMRKAREFN